MPVDKKIIDDRRRANKIIKELRKHQQEIEDAREDAIDPQSEVLTQHFQQADRNLDKTQTVDQALLDAQIFHRLGQFSKKQAEQLQSGLRTYDVKTFTDHLIAHIRLSNARRRDNSRSQQINPDELEDDEHYEKPVLDLFSFGLSVWKKYPTPPPIDSFYGKEPAETPDQERKVRAVKKTPAVKLVKPTELAAGEVAQTETDKQVAMMLRELKRRREVEFWPFVIDPNSFTRSVENVFHSSFLVKDQWAELDMKREPPILRFRDKDGSGPPGPPQPEQGSHAAVEYAPIQMSQFILGFDKVLWQEVIHKHRITRCLLPRPPKDGDTKA